MNVGGRVHKKMFAKTLALTSLEGDNASVVFTACSAVQRGERNQLMHL